VRKILLRMLDRLGHLATAVASGDEALAVYQDGLAERARFDLVITDLTMPGGLSGVKLASELLKLDPDARVIVSSGYSDASAVAEYQKYGFAAAVGKPYTLESLQEVLARFL
jgi:two-component system cell cycle sensor histidine kinase/response regulator CckA